MKAMKSNSNFFDCNECKYHYNPIPIKPEFIGFNSCDDIKQVKIKMIMQITSDHRCSLYGFKKTDKCFNWPRCKKYRERK